jgi:hypothetical protein
LGDLFQEVSQGNVGKVLAVVNYRVRVPERGPSVIGGAHSLRPWAESCSHNGKNKRTAKNKQAYFCDKNRVFLIKHFIGSFGLYQYSKRRKKGEEGVSLLFILFHDIFTL